MKKRDVLAIAFIAIISGTVSLLFSNYFISAPKNRQDKVEVIEAIGLSFRQPDSRYFNSESINPTKIIRIGDSSNPQPFSGSN